MSYCEPALLYDGVKQKLVRGIPDPMPLGKVLVPGGMSFFMLLWTL